MSFENRLFGVGSISTSSSVSRVIGFDGKERSSNGNVCSESRTMVRWAWKFFPSHSGFTVRVYVCSNDTISVCLFVRVGLDPGRTIASPNRSGCLNENWILAISKSWIRLIISFSVTVSFRVNFRFKVTCGGWWSTSVVPISFFRSFSMVILSVFSATKMIL